MKVEASDHMPLPDLENNSRNIEVKVASKKAKIKVVNREQEEYNDDTITIENSIDLVATEMTPFLFLLSLSLNCIKFLTYTSITENRSISSDDADPGVPSILIALIFSALSMTVTAFPVFKHLLMMAGSACLALKGSIFSFRLTLKTFLALTELGNFAMLYVTAVFIVPAQGSPLQIVLNCTALMAVSALDEGFFKCFKFTRKKVDEFDANYKILENNSEIFLIFVFIFGTIVTFFFLLLLYILYQYTATKEI
eukprot:gene7080-7645_t